MREFNRFYTRVIGLLQAGLAGTPHTLTEARVLFEVAGRGAIEVAELRGLLDLDAGYLSRILGRFAADGLLTREPSPDDGRRQVVRLTGPGAAAFAALDAAQATAVAKLLAPLPGSDRDRLVDAMGEIRALLGDAPRSTGLVLRPLEPGDLGWVLARHGALYAAEHRWDASFEALVARIVADYAGEHDPARETGWIAEVDGKAVGCVFCVADDDDDGYARLRLLLVEPSARGLGVGGRLVQECLRFARRAGYPGIRLWTFDALTAARRIYQAAGFRVDSEIPRHAFGHDMVEQVWSREL